MAPTYVAGIVTVLVAIQPLLGLDFLPEQWSSAIAVLMGIIIATRQIIQGRATWFGGRPKS